jgi:FMN phosphatase YigB (HAD superfamily)
MNIGFDLDKVFIDYPPLVPSTVIDRLYKKKSNGTLLYRIPSYPEQVVRRLSHLPFFRPAIKENIDFLKSISRKHNKLFLISSRFGFLKRQTEAALKRHGLAALFDNVFFNYDNEQPHVFKSKVMKKLHLDMYVDDDLALLQYVARDNDATKFFWLNTDEKGKVTKHITAITDLPAIFTDSLS